MLTVEQPMPDVIIQPGSRETSAVDNATSAGQKHKAMRYEINRLNSFINWPHSAFLSPHSLARAGFFYTQSEDLVKCPFCHVELGRWKPGDDPFDDHKKWSENCRFVRNQSDCDNVAMNDSENDDMMTSSQSQSSSPEYSFDECGKYGINIRANSVPEDDVLCNRLEQPASRFDINQYAIKTKEAAYPQYAVQEARLKTFDEWPVSLRQKPEELAAAGFYYTGKGDQTMCFSCGGGLKSWEEPDVPWEQHAKWFRNCPFLRLNKSMEYINQCANNDEKARSPRSKDFGDENKHKNVDEGASSSRENIKKEGFINEDCKNEIGSKAVGSVVVPPPSAKDDNKNVNSSGTTGNSREVSTATLCKVCFTKEVGVVFLPCGHMFSCVDCAPALKNCGVCRCKLEATVRAFLS